MNCIIPTLERDLAAQKFSVCQELIVDLLYKANAQVYKNAQFMVCLTWCTCKHVMLSAANMICKKENKM